MNQNGGEFGLTSFKLQKKPNLDNFKKGKGTTYAVVTMVVTAAQLEGREGSCGWLQGSSH